MPVVSTASAWTGGADLVVEVCCAVFGQALEPGTDNEAFGRAISPWQGWRIASGLPTILYCPWCGAVLKKAPADPRPKEVRDGNP